MSAVVAHCINIESKLNVPTVPLITSEFHTQVKTHHTIQKGMPHLRVTYLISPVWGKKTERLRKEIVMKSPVSGKMIMQEIVEGLTRPLSAEEKKTGTIEPSAGPDRFTDTPDNLQRMFMEKRMTDYMPVILPTEQKVAEMLKGTSHAPDEVVGKMAAHTAMGGEDNVEVFEHWSYTVKTVAINAVMAGCRPEYMPVLLAVASTGKEAISVSDNSFTEGLIINGPIRDEIKLNYGLGAMGPFSQANSTIGRAWNLLSINAGNCGRVGTTYMGTVGNPMNWNNVIIAENEKDSPWRPFHVRRGFKPAESVVTLCEGWGVLSAKNSKYSVWQKEMDFPGIVKRIVNDQDGLFGALVVLNPTVAAFIKEAGFDTVEKFTEYLLAPAEGQPAPPPPKLPDSKGPAPKGKMPRFGRLQVNIVVTGGSNNNYWSYGGMACRQSVPIDKWR
ncbi:MAG: hypothetical protein JXA41_11810 [Deltaproteobacteria bacterium]|nr:hypothetical protein [Deltaproteobacteria bacterium]